MLAITQIQWWHWVTFNLAVLLFLAFDLGVLHREARAVRFREALAWTCFLFVMALAFGATLIPVRGQEEALEFLTGYIIELSLSMDNVFVIAVIFAYFKVPLEYQHRVLFWGILGALVMRGLMIWLGSELVAAYHWTLYIFGIFLVITGAKILLGDDESMEPERNPVLRIARRYLRFTTRFDGHKFLTWEDGRRVFTPLALVLLMVETCDLVFALDSIPAIFAVTTKPFIIFTSNVFAILGLRSLYFALAGAIAYFRYLKYGLSIVLMFIGFKMLIAEWVKVPIGVSLGVVAGIILGSVMWSVISARRKNACPPPGGAKPPSGG